MLIQYFIRLDNFNNQIYVRTTRYIRNIIRKYILIKFNDVYYYY